MCIVVVVSVYIFLSFISYWALVVFPWRWWETFWGLLNIIIFNTIVALMAKSYYASIVTFPGAPPHPYKPPHLSPAQLAEFMDGKYKPRKIFNQIAPFEPRWCDVCDNFKPPRAHHCKELSSCVLKMDHYCPFINNCVGYRNHKVFFLFVFYASVGLLMLITTILFRIISDVAVKIDSVHPIETLIAVFHVAISLPITLCIMSLCTHQFFSILEDCTSIEGYLYDALKKDSRIKKRPFVWIFDFGAARNWEEFFGTNRWEWLLPVMPDHIAHGSGVEFDYVPGDEEEHSVVVGDGVVVDRMEGGSTGSGRWQDSEDTRVVVL